MPTSRLLLLLWCAASCTLPVSRQMLDPVVDAAVLDAPIVSEEDQGLAILGVILVAEPEHYAVLIERARERYHCTELRNVQFDYAVQHWLVVGFPIARVTGLCVREAPPTDGGG